MRNRFKFRFHCSNDSSFIPIALYCTTRKIRLSSHNFDLSSTHSRFSRVLMLRPRPQNYTQIKPPSPRQQRSAVPIGAASAVFSRCTKFAAAAADAIFLFLLGCSSRVSSRWKKKSHTHLFRTLNHGFRAVLDRIRFPDTVADVFEQFWTHQKHRKMVFGGSENCFLLASKFLRGAFSDYFSFLMQNAAESGTRFVSSDSLLLCSFRIRKTCATSR